MEMTDWKFRRIKSDILRIGTIFSRVPLGSLYQLFYTDNLIAFAQTHQPDTLSVSSYD